ncbi:MAG: cyclophilin-like fold protein [Spirosomataceae bacterium]
MHRLTFTFTVLFSMGAWGVPCSKDNNNLNQVSIHQSMFENTANNPENRTEIRVKIGDKPFIATLADSPTANAFKALLPLTLPMNELNNNEKYAQLPKNLPTDASVPKSIQSGDLMLYGSNTLVLFYKGFTTSYSYTKIGKVEDAAGLVTTLGAGEVKVSFEAQKE